MLMSTSTSSEMGGAWGGSGLAASPETAASCPLVSVVAAAAGAAGERPSACWLAVVSLFCGFGAGAVSAAGLGGVWAIFCSVVFFFLFFLALGQGSLFFGLVRFVRPGRFIRFIRGVRLGRSFNAGLARHQQRHLGGCGMGDCETAQRHKQPQAAGSGQKNTRGVKKKARDMGSPGRIRRAL